MIKKIVTALLFSFFCLTVAQAQLVFSEVSLQEAFRLAKANDKMVLLMMESPDCTQCNEVAKLGLANGELINSINKNCITLKIKQDSKNFAEADAIYSIGTSMGLLFLDADGNILTRYRATTSLSATYVDLLNQALAKKEHPDNTLKELQSAYDNGKKDFDVLYKLVRKKNELELVHDELTEEMVTLAPEDSTRSLSFLQFIAEQAPVLNSNADAYMRKDQRNFNDAWYLMPQQKRASINNRIIFKSRTKAIKEKNRAYAERVANFAAATNTDRVLARKGHDKNMIAYFKAISDTANFLSASVRYYDQYLMTINVDSLKRVDSLRRRDIFSAAAPSTPPTAAERQAAANGAPIIRVGTVPYAPIMQGYTSELNDGAWTIYTYTHEPVFITKAIEWAKRAVEFFENPAAIDTYARLLYRAGNKDQAIAMEEKAIEANRIRKMPPGDYETLLKKMKAGVAAIDKY